jgi:hypothetical protein
MSRMERWVLDFEIKMVRLFTSNCYVKQITGQNDPMAEVVRILFDSASAIVSYCAIELPTAENILVELDPMIRTVPTASRMTTANMTAHSQTTGGKP